MLAAETFELLQTQRAHYANSVFGMPELDTDNPCVMTNPGFQNILLRNVGQLCFNLVPPHQEDTQLPTDGEVYESWFTNKAPSAELISEADQKLLVFILRNRPADMGSFAMHRVIVTDSQQADEALLDEFPLLVTWGRPSGIYAATSPLLCDAAAPEIWQFVVPGIVEELGQTPLASNI